LTGMSGRRSAASSIAVRVAERKALRRMRAFHRVGTGFTVVGTLLAALGLAGLVLTAGPPEGPLERARGPAAGLPAAPPEDAPVAVAVDPAAVSRTETEDASAESGSVPTQVALTPAPASVVTTAGPTPVVLRTGTGPGPRDDATAGTSSAPVREAPTSAPTPEPTPARSRTPTPAGPILAAPPARSLPITRVVVPRLALAADVVPARLVEQGGGLTWEVPALRAGHAEATAGAGGLGNAVVLGHVASRGAGNVFKDLDKARAGDAVQVFSGEEQFDYRVVEVREVDRTDVSVAAPTEAPGLSLITCTGIWLPFVRDYTGRLVVRAELADAATALRPPAPASRVPTDAALLRTVFEERFADNRRGWPHDPHATAWFADGSYRLYAREPGRFVAVGPPIATPLRDVVVTGTFRKVGGPPGGGYGLIVRDQGRGPRDGVNQGGRYYVLEAGDRGELGIWRREEDRWLDIVSWTPSEVVRPGGATNVLTAQAAGDQLVFLVNGTPVASVADSTLAEGTVGLFAGGDRNEVAVDHFVVQAPD
jgi:LPXTG-site transpeptidase (sortase) family protein